MLLPMGRPEYAPMPEVLISALAATILDAKPLNALDNRSRVVYKNLMISPARAALIETRPSDTKLEQVGSALESAGLTADHCSMSVLAKSVVHSVTGTRSAGSKSQPTSPMTRSLAMMQNLRGVLNKSGPPDLGNILEELYALGSDQYWSGEKAARKWLYAVDRRVAKDDLLRSLDAALSDAVFGLPDLRKREIESSRSSSVDIRIGSSPYTWMHRKWNQLTSDVWIDALPARTWVDWATTVLRFGLGMGYLWESAWYECLARQIINPVDPTWTGIRNSMPTVLSWHSSTLPSSMRDVRKPMHRRIYRGYALKKCIEKWIQDNKAYDLDFSEAVLKMSTDKKWRILLTEAAKGQDPAAKNTFETVRYSLLVRDSVGEFADHFGFLQQRGNYLVPSPGTECIAALASLSCSGPDGSTDLRTLIRDLTELGLRPEQRDLIELLEIAGLARGSADADQGLVIESAFNVTAK